MTRIIITLTVVFLLTLLSMGQTTSASKLYDSKGRLLADTTFIITKSQLAKWTAIEDTLTKIILNRLEYPIMEYYNAISGKFIISFRLDTDGKFNDLRSTKADDNLPDSIHSSWNTRFLKSCFETTIFFSGRFLKNGFRSGKKNVEQYYLPFCFIVYSKTNAKQIKNGWLTIENKEPEVIQPTQNIKAD